MGTGYGQAVPLPRRPAPGVPVPGVTFVYTPPMAPTGPRKITVYGPDGRDVGVNYWSVCAACRCGVILRISLAPGWQRCGLGRRLVLRALRDGPGYRWSTTGQSPVARRFFPVLSAETGVVLQATDTECDHLKDGDWGTGDPAVPRPRPVPDPTV